MKLRLRNISIKWRVFITFSGFAIVLLAVLWFFQILYLDDFYRKIKKNETERIMMEVNLLVGSGDDVSEQLDSIAASNNIAIYVTDNEGNPVYNAEYISNSQMSTLPKSLFKRFYNSAVKEGGQTQIEFQGSEILDRQQRQQYNQDQRFMKENMPPVEDGTSQATPEGQAGDTLKEQDVETGVESETDLNEQDSSDNEAENEDTNNESEEQVEEEITKEATNPGEEHKGRLEYTIPKEIEEFEQPFMQNFGNELAESIIYVKILNINDTEYVIMVNSVLTPVDATVTTLKSQLFIISAIMIVIAFITAIVLSFRISRSIIRLNDGAKRLAQGDYAVEFNSRDYEEVSELTDTLNYAAKELGKIDELQKELIANISHDLRTPLTMIKGYAEVMRDIPGENSPENIQVVIDETERLTGLVNDMLDISKLRAGTITIEPEEYNITESIRHVLTRYNKLREQEGYIIDFDYESDVTIYADEQKMYQVLYNLFNNAINYTGPDKRIRVVQRTHDNLLRIDVIDTGNGVAAEDIPYVWDRYYKDKTNHVRAKAGTGLGLSIVKAILELHGAKYGVISQQGQGADFWFEIRIDPFEDEEEDNMI